MFKIWLYPQQVRVARFISTQQQSCLRRHSTLNDKLHPSFSNQPSHFLPQPTFFMSSFTSPSSFDLWPQNLMPFLGCQLSLSSAHDHTNEHYYSQLIHSFLKAQHEHQIRRSFSVFELHSTHCSHHGSLCPSYNSHLTFFQATFFTSIQY